MIVTMQTIILRKRNRRVARVIYRAGVLAVTRLLFNVAFD